VLGTFLETAQADGFAIGRYAGVHRPWRHRIPFERLGKGLDLLDGQVRRPVVLADIEDRHHVRMLEAGERLRFLVKPIPRLGRGVLSAGRHNDRHQAIEGRLARFLDDPHSPLAQGFEELERAQPPAFLAFTRERMYCRSGSGQAMHRSFNVPGREDAPTRNKHPDVIGIAPKCGWLCVDFSWARGKRKGAMTQ